MTRVRMQPRVVLTHDGAKPKLLRVRTPGDSPSRAAMIELQDVSEWYGQFRALDGCTTWVARGSVVVVCGPSGSGKSTLIRCVNGLEPVDSGWIVFDAVVVLAPKP